MRPTLLVVLLLALTVAAQDCHQGALIDTNAFLASVRGICVSIVPSHRGFRFTVLDAPFLGGVRVTNCTDG